MPFLLAAGLDTTRADYTDTRELLLAPGYDYAMHSRILTVADVVVTGYGFMTDLTLARASAGGGGGVDALEVRDCGFSDFTARPAAPALFGSGSTLPRVDEAIVVMHPWTWNW